MIELRKNPTLAFTPLILLLASCSPRDSRFELIPESQKEGYMRIIGDLRWDKMSSRKDWGKRFPKCTGVVNGNPYVGAYGVMVSGGKVDGCSFDEGGIRFQILEVNFQNSKGSPSGTSLADVKLEVPDRAQLKEFESAIATKYPGGCSQYSCFAFEYGNIKIMPSAKASKIANQINVDYSRF